MVSSLILLRSLRDLNKIREETFMGFWVKRLWGSELRWARGAQYVAAKSVFKMARRFSPVGVGVKLSSFVMKIPKFACMVLCSQRLLPKLRLYGGTKIVWFCMFNSREQAIVFKGTVKNTWSLVLSYFSSIFSFKRLFCGHYSCDILMFWEKQYLRKKPMFLVCWNLQVGADIYAFYNRVVLSCLAGCLSKQLWVMIAEYSWRRSKAVSEKNIASIKHPYQWETIRN